MKKAFTMIELVFVIVILGILAAVALPRMNNSSLQATIAKGRADVATIRSAIVNERQTRLITGESVWISELSQNANTPLFDGNGSSVLLMYGITAGANSGDWSRNVAPNDNQYVYRVGTTQTTFTYDNTDGTFTCVAGNANCDDLIQ